MKNIYCITSISDKRLSSFFISLIFSLYFYSLLLFPLPFRFNFVVSERNVHILFCRHIWAELSLLFRTILSGTFFPGGRWGGGGWVGGVGCTCTCNSPAYAPVNHLYFVSVCVCVCVCVCVRERENYQKYIMSCFRCLISPTTSFLKHGLQLKRLIKTLKINK